MRLNIFKKDPLPNLVIIGAQKSATRWLRDMLNDHPDIFMASRELEFFNHNYDKGVSWYRSHFKGSGAVNVRGESTPGYMMLVDNPKQSAERIQKTLQGVKLVALLRDPVERLGSAYVHHIRMGRLTPETSLMQYLEQTDPGQDPLGLVSGGWYERSLDPYFQKFGSRLMIALHEDLKSSPKTLYDTTLDHVDVKRGFYPKGLEKVLHSNRSEVSDRALESSRLSKSDRAKIYKKYFAQDALKLEERTGLDLSLWRANNNLK